jgi:hypothetical protein
MKAGVRLLSLDMAYHDRPECCPNMKAMFLVLVILAIGYYVYSEVSAREGTAKGALTALDSRVEEPKQVTLPLARRSPDRDFQAVVQRLYEEWRHRHASTERMQYGVRRDMSQLLSRIKLRGPHLESAILHDLRLGLLELGVDPREAQQVAASILAEAEKDGRKARRAPAARGDADRLPADLLR